MASLPPSTVANGFRLFDIPTTDGLRGMVTITRAADGQAIRQFCPGTNPNLPVIASVSPASAKVGEFVTITGSKLSVALEVDFGTVPIQSGDVGSLSDTQITCKVPVGAGNNVRVRTSVGTSNYFPFTVTIPPVIPAVTYKTDQFSYSGSWQDSGPAAGTYSGHVFYTSIPGDTATCSIVIPSGGGRVAIIQNRSNAYGPVTLLLDGQGLDAFTPYAASAVPADENAPVHITPFIAAGTYALTIKNGSGTCVVDAVRVLPGN